MIFLLVNMYGVYALALRTQDRNLFKRLLVISYVVAAVGSVYGVAQYFGIEWIWPQNLNPYGSRPVSTFGNPNFMSSYLVVALPVMIADYACPVTGLPRFLLGGMVMSVVFALCATLTRSSWAGAAVAILILIMGLRSSQALWLKIRRPVIVLLVCMTLGAALWPRGSSTSYTATPLQRLAEVKKISQGSYSSASQRLLIWLCAWKMVEDHPMMGKGWGCFELFYPFYQGPQLLTERFRAWRTHANNAHNEALEIWSQAGGLGLGVAILFWIVFFRSGMNLAKRLAPPWNAVEWGILGGVAGMLIDNLLNVSIHFTIPALIVWWWVGSALTLEPASLQLRRFAIHGLWRRGILTLTVLMMIGWMGRSACLWAAEVYFFKGFKGSKSGTNLMAVARALEKAYRFHRLEVNNNYELANVYARLGQNEDALFMYQRALDANAGYDEIYFNRASLLLQMKRIPEAIQDFRISLAINPLSYEGYRTLLSLYIQDFPHYRTESEALCRQALQAFPQDKDLWNNLGYVQVQKKEWKEAAQSYRTALAIDPRYEVARRNLQFVETNLLQ